jgi:ankyrin repeat protein
MGFQKSSAAGKKKKKSGGGSSSSSKVKISSQTPIFGSIEDGDDEEFEFVLRETPDSINERNKNGWSPLHQACFSDRVDFAKKLVELVGEENRVAYINAPCKDGDTPLHYAACQDAVSCVEFLLDQEGIVLEWKDLDEETAIDVARPKAKRLIKERLEKIAAAAAAAANKSSDEVMMMTD